MINYRLRLVDKILFNWDKLKRNKSLISVLFALISGLILGKIVIASNPVLWLAFLSVIFSCIIFMNHKIGVLFLFISIFFLGWFSAYLKILPRQATWLTELTLFILFVKMVLLQLKNNVWKRTPIDKLVIFLLLTSFFSAILNSDSSVVVLLGFRNFFKYIFMFYILINLDLEEKFYKNMIKLLIVIAILQIPVTIIEWFFWGTGDNVVGTLGAHGTGSMGIFMAFIACLLVGFYMQMGNLFSIGLLILLFVPVVLGSARFGILVIPLSVLFSLMLNQQWDMRKFIKFLAGVIIIVVAIAGAVISHDQMAERGRFIDNFASTKNMFDYTTGYTKGGTLNRTESVVFASKLINQNPTNFILGFGPGSASPSYIGFAGAIEKKYSDLRIWAVQLSWTLLEFGFWGLLLFLGMFYTLFRNNRKFYIEINDGFWKAVSLGYNGIVFVFIISIPYTPCWISDYLAGTFWFLSAAIFSRCSLKTNANI